MTLKDYYNSLDDNSPKVQFRDKVILECGVSLDTFYKWMNGGVKEVPFLASRKISEIAGIPVEELFPEPTEVNHE